MLEEKKSGARGEDEAQDGQGPTEEERELINKVLRRSDLKKNIIQTLGDG